ncbi:MAG: hypothetical protein V7749_01080 [Cocleimonas sp.]
MLNMDLPSYIDTTKMVAIRLIPNALIGYNPKIEDVTGYAIRAISDHGSFHSEGNQHIKILYPKDYSLSQIREIAECLANSLNVIFDDRTINLVKHRN